MSQLNEKLTKLYEGNTDLPVGKHNHVPDSDFDPRELKMGIEVEKEHTDSEEIAKAIAKDHLAECSTYYSRLEIMENDCKSEK